MDITPLIKSNQQVIQSYSAEGFRISGERFEKAVLVRPGGTELWDIANDVAAEDLTEGDFAQLTANAEETDVVLLGCGKTMVFMDEGLRNSLRAKGLIIEVMDTGAACRTYNLLMSEGRRVVAALMISG